VFGFWSPLADEIVGLMPVSRQASGGFSVIGDFAISIAVGEKERPICHRLLREVRLQLAWQRFSRFLMTGGLT